MKEEQKEGKMEGRDRWEGGMKGKTERRSEEVRKGGKILPWFPDSCESFLQRDYVDFCVGVLN